MAIAIVFGLSLATQVILYAGVVVVMLFVVIIASGRDFFVGRRRMKQQRWEDAACCFAKFEAQQLDSRWRWATAPLFVGLYTYDGVAIALNNQGVVRLNQGERTQAEGLLRRALERDPLYAIPHVNLALLAASAGDTASALREQELAQMLGFRGRGLQKTIRSLLAKTNVTISAGIVHER